MSNFDDCFNGKRDESSPSLDIEAFLETCISSSPTNDSSESEAIVRRAAIAAVTRVASQKALVERLDPALWRRVVSSVRSTGSADFDYDVKRHCVAFWRTELMRRREPTVADVGDESPSPQKVRKGAATEEIVDILVSFAAKDEDISVRRCAKDSLDQIG